jgi:hypothetical protein
VHGRKDDIELNIREIVCKEVNRANHAFTLFIEYKRMDKTDSQMLQLPPKGRSIKGDVTRFALCQIFSRSIAWPPGGAIPKLSLD